MNKIEAIKMVKQIKSECYSRESCEGCPFYCDKSCIYTCSLRYVSDDGFNEKFFDELLAEAKKEEQATLKNVKELHIPVGRSAEELNSALQNRLEQQGLALNLAHDALIPSSVVKHDNVNSPKHYCKGGLECIQVIKAQLTPEQNKGYLYGNVLKYMWRWPEKNGLEDLRKAKHYLEWLIEEVNETGKPVSSAE